MVREEERLAGSWQGRFCEREREDSWVVEYTEGTGAEILVSGRRGRIKVSVGAEQGVVVEISSRSPFIQSRGVPRPVSLNPAAGVLCQWHVENAIKGLQIYHGPSCKLRYVGEILLECPWIPVRIRKRDVNFTLINCRYSTWI